MATRLQEKDLLEQAKTIVPPLGGNRHKGQSGRVGVVGGSKDYTGAPFYSSFSALRMGADLSHVICEPSAGAVIKTYSPDLIVHTLISEEDPARLDSELSSLLSRLHALVIGPGLGREEYTQNAGHLAISRARQEKMYIVIDADGLFLLQNDPDPVMGYEKAVLTPNPVEMQRLCKKVGVDTKSSPQEQAVNLAKALKGVTIVMKGATDIITNGHEIVECNEPGGLKRSGGQGDILSGTIGTWLAWGKVWEEENGGGSAEGEGGSAPLAPSKLTLLAAVAGCTITRNCSREAYQKMGRSVQTSDMLGEIGRVFEKHFGGVGVDEEASKL